MTTGSKALLAGCAGACTLTVLHQTLRAVSDDAPRMDVLGMRALAAAHRALDGEVPSDEDLHREALIGDITLNTIYYSLAGALGARNALWFGGLLGLVAGVASATLPSKAGLGADASERNVRTQALTVLLYSLGGVTAGAILQDRNTSSSDESW